MSEPIYIHRYTLHSRTGLNSRTQKQAHEGILIRMNDGVGCIHPWEVLGDPPLEQVIKNLKRRHLFRPMIRAAIKCAMVDGAARKQGVSVFDSVEVPKSHATITGGMEAIDAAVQSGFETIKVKAGRALEEELELLRAAYAKYPSLRWRIDFNHSQSIGQTRYFVESMPECLRAQIDFLEDACQPSNKALVGERSLFSIPLAIDQGVEGASHQYSYAVIKPAVDDVTALCAKSMMEGWKVVLTSYMDHPIGQSFAAWVAGKANKRFMGLLDSTCGLMTHELFEPTAFTERLGSATPQWKSPGGTGLGFDDLIENIDWEKI